jgi:cystathionine beta-lyase family protein involved in aluminum resistance
VPEGQRLAFQGLFLAPGAVGEALLGAVYARALFGALGFPVEPAPNAAAPSDIVTRITLGARDRVLRALAAVQAASPVDSRAVPEAAAMPGYPDAVAMAAGTFVQGSGLELSADAPMRPPWHLFVQGGLRLAATRRALDAAAAAVLARPSPEAAGTEVHAAHGPI